MTNPNFNLPLHSHLLYLVNVELVHVWNEVLTIIGSPLYSILSGLLEPKDYKNVLAYISSVSFQPLLFCFSNKTQK